MRIVNLYTLKTEEITTVNQRFITVPPKQILRFEGVDYKSSKNIGNLQHYNIFRVQNCKYGAMRESLLAVEPGLAEMLKS